MLVAITYYLMFLLQLLPFRSQNCELYFSNVFTLETKLSTSPVFVIIYFCFYFFIYFLMLYHWHDQKAYHVDGHYTRYEINIMVTPKAQCLLLGPKEGRDIQSFDNWWILQSMDHTIAAAEYAPMLHN